LYVYATASLPSQNTAEKLPSHFRGCQWLCKGEMWTHFWHFLIIKPSLPFIDYYCYRYRWW